MSELTSRLVHAPIRSVVCEPKVDVCDIILRKKKQKQHSSQQKQHNINSTQHRIIVYIHPLPFRSIAGFRILHRCSHLACYHCSSLLCRFCFVHVKFDIAGLVLLWSVLLLHHAGSRNRPGPGTGIVHEIGCSKTEIVCEG